MFKRLAAILGSLGMVLLAAAPVLAADITNTLPISSDDAEHQGSTEECAELDLESGEVAWHFVINQSSTDDQTLTVEFENAGVLTQGPDTVVDAYVLHYYFFTGEDTLLSASSSGDGNLQLSHICNGGPPPEIPESPMSALLLLTAALTGIGFVGWRMRQAATVA